MSQSRIGGLLRCCYKPHRASLVEQGDPEEFAKRDLSDHKAAAVPVLSHQASRPFSQQNTDGNDHDSVETGTVMYKIQSDDARDIKINGTICVAVEESSVCVATVSLPDNNAASYIAIDMMMLLYVSWILLRGTDITTAQNVKPANDETAAIQIIGNNHEMVTKLLDKSLQPNFNEEARCDFSTLANHEPQPILEVRALTKDDEDQPSSEVKTLVERLEAIALTLTQQSDEELLAVETIAQENHDFDKHEILNETLASQLEKKATEVQFWLDDTDWILSGHHGNHSLVINAADSDQSVQLTHTDDSTLQIHGKVKAIRLENCKKTAVVFDESSSLDIVRCQRIQVQVLGEVGSVRVHETDGLSVYLSQAASQTALVNASKYSEVNLLIEDPHDDNGSSSSTAASQFKEFAVPEQFRSHWNGSRWVTEATDINK